MIKRALSASLVAAAVVALVVAGHASAGPRNRQLVIEERYLTPSGVRTVHWDEVPRMLPEPPPVVFTPRDDDQYIHLDFTDDHWEDVWINISQAAAGSDHKAIDYDMCGTHTAFKLKSSKPVEVRIYDGLCETHLWSFGSSGTVKAIFSPTEDWNIGPMYHHHHPY